MAIFAVTYTYGDTVDLINEHRPAHRAYMAELAQQGKVMGSGPFTDEGKAGAMLVLTAENSDEIEALLAEDPFMVQGVVTQHTVREWSINTGPWA